MKKIAIQYLFLIFLSVTVLLENSCRKEESPITKPSSNPKADRISPALGSSNTVVTLIGSGLGDIRSVVFDKDSIPADFNPVFNTDGSLIFRVPTEAVPGQQNITFINGANIKFTIPFNVLGLPTVLSVSNYNFETGTQLTLTGKNLDDVSKVVLSGTTTEVTIVSKTPTSLVISMPATTLYRATLDITNMAGTVATTQEFVSLLNNVNVFTDSYGAGFADGSWGPNEISTTVFKSGTASASKSLPKGNWWVAGFAYWDAPFIVNDPSYKFLSFWIKGGLMDQTMYFTSSLRAAGFGNADQTTPLTIPAGIWTYFKMPIGSLNLWATAGDFKQFGFWIKGPENANETFYFDDVMFVK